MKASSIETICLVYIIVLSAIIGLSGVFGYSFLPDDLVKILQLSVVAAAFIVWYLPTEHSPQE